MFERLFENNKKVLIVGASGFVGGYMLDLLGEERAVGTYHDAPVPGGVMFDVRTMSLAESIKDPSLFSHAFVLFGDTHPDSCQRDPENAHAINVTGAIHVIDQLSAWGIPFSFTSSESVFDGEKGNYREDDVARPIMLYGDQKLAIEKYLALKDCPYTITRLGKVIGSDPRTDKLYAGWIKAMDEGTTIRCAVDQTFSPIHVSDVVDGLLRAAEQKVYGLFHLCGAKGYSRLQLLHLTYNAFKKHKDVSSVIEECSIDDFDLLEPRPKDVSMSPAKLVAATGLKLKSMEAVTDAVVESYFSGKPANIR